MRRRDSQPETLTPEDKMRVQTLAARVLAEPDWAARTRMLQEATPYLNEPGWEHRIQELIGALIGGYDAVLLIVDSDTRDRVRDRFAMIADANDVNLNDITLSDFGDDDG